jgi:hypothetical protein
MRNKIKLISSVIILLLSFSGLGYTQELPLIENDAFQRGEKVKYRVFYDAWLTSGMTAGTGTITVHHSTKQFQGRNTYYVGIEARSVGLFNFFFKVRDKFESWIDEQYMVPWQFKRDIYEGGYEKKEDVLFDRVNNTATSTNKTIEVPPMVQDIVSSFYYMRTLDYSDAIPGDEFFIDFILDDSVYNSKIIFLGREIVETKLGKFRCLKFKPMVAQGEVFDEPYPMTLWVTDDRNLVPVLGSSAVIIGSIKLELIEVEGLRHPMEAKIN